MPEDIDRKRRKPQQARSRAMYDDILDAAARVLIEEGFDRTTTTRIADRAGISAGSLYQYFSNRTAIFNALETREFDQFAQLLTVHSSASAGSDLDSAIGRMVDMVFDAQDGQRAIKVIFTSVLAQSGLADPSVRRTERIIAHIRQLLDRHAADFPDGFDFAQAAFSIGCLFEGFLHAFSLPGTPHSRPDVLSSEFKSILRCYLDASRRYPGQTVAVSPCTPGR